ncbi:pheromone processing endoprotease [Entomophthora muscae]|uniref:Pheromone processing endoprotease n=2 Tax=Entomophthora muscae TaxID=34485 RepID=A0ACC2SGP4_9FUNG|nr:pheromone processing endoprotease [Entomophthora muscae]KAJ9061566.1 pheromone processing endoprotease [Entomophthora muscae]
MFLFKGLVIIDDRVTDELEAKALNYMYDDNHIYSMSYGDEDQPNSLAQLHKSIRVAFKKGAVHGRNKKGSLYVVSAGNGKNNHDNCAFDDSCNSIYTIAVGSIDRHDKWSQFSEACTSVIVTAYSGSTLFDGLSTVSGMLYPEAGMISGTSASAPLVSEVLALVLQVR